MNDNSTNDEKKVNRFKGSILGDYIDTKEPKYIQVLILRAIATAVILLCIKAVVFAADSSLEQKANGFASVKDYLSLAALFFAIAELRLMKIKVGLIMLAFVFIFQLELILRWLVS